MPENNKVRPLRRRDFLQTFLCGGIAAAASQGLIGCGGGGSTSGGKGGNANNGSTASKGSVLTVSGTVSVPGVLSAGTQVLSAYSGIPADGSSGKFSITVSSAVCHVIILVDGSGTIRGMAVSAPSLSLTTQISIDLTSTAISVLFLTPGITAVNPKDAQSRIQTISSLPQFSAFRDALNTALAQGSLAVAVAVPTVRSAYAACVSSFLGGSRQVARSSREITADNTANNDRTIGFALGDVSTPSTVALTISNADLRVIEVYRKDLQQSGANSVITRFGDIAGAEGISIGGILTDRTGTPSTVQLSLNMSITGAYRSEFYFRSWGISTPGQIIPPDVRAAFIGTDAVNSATISTIFLELYRAPSFVCFGVCAQPPRGK